jgi:nicotinate-nucleotide adenylyltransferase
MRIGLFGGTFNPIHLGHLRSAEEIREAFTLDRVYFVPAARPPHKAGEDIASATHRLNMVELAVADNPFFSASAVELERQGLSYSIDTIRYFLTTIQPATLFFLAGFDAFREIHTWKDYAEIPALCDLIITSRPGLQFPPPEAVLPVALQNAFWYDSPQNMYHHTSGHSLFLYQLEGLDISASQVRKKIRHSQSIRYLVPLSVETYIQEHALYRSEERTH